MLRTPLLAARIVRRYYRTYGRLPNLLSPQSYSEKIQHRKLFDRRPYLSETSDKFAMRAYAARVLGEDLTPELYYRTSDPHSIPFASLPRRFVVKATHGSGWLWIVKDRNTLDTRALIAACEKWLRTDYSRHGDEPFYSKIPRQIIVEEFLDDGTGRPPTDLKLLVFNQQVRVVQVDTDRFGDHRRKFLDADWNVLPIHDSRGRIEGDVERPSRLADIIAIAEALACDTDFVRIDCYQVANRICLGEMTHAPGTGLSPLYPAIWDERFGAMWKRHLE